MADESAPPDEPPTTEQTPAAGPATASGPSTGLAELGIGPTLARLATDLGWTAATGIQRAAIPKILEGRDVLGLSRTGTGKTAAFALPLLQRLQDGDARVAPADGTAASRPRPVRGLVVAPTRELAVQTGAVLRSLAAPLKCVVAVGGVSINPQMMALRGGADIVVGTPGRLQDLVDRNALQLGAVQILVLDEADRLLDMGFAPQVSALLERMPAPPLRQTLMFSATLPDAVGELGARALHDPVRVDAEIDGAAGPVPGLKQRAVVVDTRRRTALLQHLFKSERWDRALVFVATQYAAEHVAEKLRKAGLPAAALHAGQSAGRRGQALADIQQGRLAVLVATDVAARGIDLPGLAVVVNHDLPRSAVDHTHRIGRTARASRDGLGLSFVCADAPGSEAHFRLIENRLQMRVEREVVAGFEPAAPVNPGAADNADVMDPAAPPAPRRGDAPANFGGNGGVKGRRKSRKDKLREAQARSS